MVLILTLTYLVSILIIGYGKVHNSIAPYQISATSADAIDEQLYSRQIFVYGKTAQDSLQNANILVYGSGCIAAEVLKNLALAGAGKISVFEDGGERIGPRPHLIGPQDSLADYSKTLNKHVKVCLVTLFLQAIILICVFCPRSLGCHT